mgnify:CR=1 FL=1
MKLLCKLFGHKWIYYDLHKRCKWCDERVWFIRDIELLKGLKKAQEAFRSFGIACKELSFNRSDLDESEDMIIDEDRVKDLWDRCLKSNSYTHMGSEIRFDKIADMVIGKNQWHMREQALITIKAMCKLLSPEKKLEILKVSGVSKHDIDNCYRKDKQ